MVAAALLDLLPPVVLLRLLLLLFKLAEAKFGSMTLGCVRPPPEIYSLRLIKSKEKRYDIPGTVSSRCPLASLAPFPMLVLEERV